MNYLILTVMIERIGTKNTLDKQNYLIPQDLHLYLHRSCKEENNFYEFGNRTKWVEKNPVGLNLLNFRILNRENKSLVYSYVFYRTEFSLSLIVFLLLRGYYIRRNHSEWGLYTALLDNMFLNVDGIDKYLSMNNGIDTKLSFPYVKNSFHSIEELRYVDIKTMSEFSRHLLHVNNSDILSSLLFHAFHRNYKEYCKLFYSPLYSKNFSKPLYQPDIIPVNLLDNMLFVVYDQELFIQQIKDKGFIVSQGPQSVRGQISATSSFIHTFDNKYRDSLYDHYYYHRRANTLPRYTIDSPMRRKHFSYRNIHQNLGNSRWYSSTSKRLDVKQEKKISFTYENSYFNSIYHQLSLLFNNENGIVINASSQIKIENWIQESFKEWIENKPSSTVSGISLDNLNTKLKSLLLKSRLEYLNRFEIFYNKLVEDSAKSKDKYGLSDSKRNIIYMRDIFGSLDRDEIVNIVFVHYLRWVTYVDTDEAAFIYLVNTSNDLGKEILNRFFYKQYREHIIDLNENSKNNISFSIWKENNLDNFSSIPTLQSRIGTFLIEILIALDLIEEIKTVKKQNSSKEIINVLTFPKEIKKLWSNIKFFVPLRLPMIVPPKQYSEKIVKEKKYEVLGGYLTNDVVIDNKVFISKSSYRNSSYTLNNNIYDMVNKISSIPYKINEEVLDFILKNADKYGFLLKESDIEAIKDNYSGKRKWESSIAHNKYRALKSKYVLEQNIIQISYLFRNIDKFYFPVRLDQRGRVYCQPNYLNYQSTDLAKSLICFSEASTINRDDSEAIQYLKLYGANCFGNGISKLSHNSRVEWVNDNETNIINYENSILLTKAKNKWLFLAFCIEYKRFWEFYNESDRIEFKTRLPIQLDATCNGFQHLALLSNEKQLFEVLNLRKSEKSDAPKDFYSYMLSKLLDKIDNRINAADVDLQEIVSLKRISNFIWSRTHIKKAIMTIPYNATVSSIHNYMSEAIGVPFKEGPENVYVKGKNINRYTVWYLIDGNEINNHDISIIVSYIKQIVDVDFQQLRNLTLYLKNVANTCSALKVPITWSLPHGLLISQSYLEVNTVKLKAFNYSSKTINISVPDVNNINKRKQVTALMPNLIHSLDASSLTSLFLNFVKLNPNDHNFYSIHDCFSTTANKIPDLIRILKTVYTQLYSNEPYIQKFDDCVIKGIKAHYAEDIKWSPKERKFTFNNNQYRLHSLDWVFGRENCSKRKLDLINSQYLIN